MSEHGCTLEWRRGDAPFLDQRYSRAHRWRFDGGAEVAASSSPHIVPVPMSEPSAVDPEEAFVAALASCHLLWFLAIAAKSGFVVEAYVDEPFGVLEKDSEGRLALARVTLRPRVRFAAPVPDADAHAALHEQAHAHCFLARAVRCALHCEPRLEEATA